MLILVRHGRTAANASGLLQGRTDNPLDEHGRRQAACVASALAGGVDRVISSPLCRARQTAAALGLPIEVDERWIELDYGIYDGQPMTSVGADVWERWRTDMGFVPEGGESLYTLGMRVVAACLELLPEAADENVVVVSHVSPIKAAVAWALGAGVETAWRSHLDQASICRILAGPRGPVLHSFNETGHLADTLVPPRPTG